MNKTADYQVLKPIATNGGNVRAEKGSVVALSATEAEFLVLSGHVAPLGADEQAAPAKDAAPPTPSKKAKDK